MNKRDIRLTLEVWGIKLRKYVRLLAFVGCLGALAAGLYLLLSGDTSVPVIQSVRVGGLYYGESIVAVLSGLVLILSAVVATVKLT